MNMLTFNSSGLFFSTYFLKSKHLDTFLCTFLMLKLLVFVKATTRAIKVPL